MKRKLAFNPHPETVRIVRPKIQIVNETSSISTTTSAESNQSSNVKVVSLATDYRDEDSASESQSSSELSESSSDDSVSTSDDSSDEDSELDSDNDSGSDDMSSSSESEGVDEKDIIIIPTGLATTVITDAETGITTLRTGQKPKVDHSYCEKPSLLMKRLQNFIPKMLDANNILDEEQKAGVLSERILEMDVDGEDSGGQYIEMNLGLGVLEEQHSEETQCDESDSDMDADVLGKLFNNPNLTKQSQIIQEVSDVPDR